MSSLMVVSNARQDYLSLFLAQYGGGLVMGLRTDSTPVTPSMDMGEITEPTFTGYQRADAGPWSTIVYGTNGDAQSTGFTCTWVNQDTTSPTITGYFLLNLSTTHLHSAITLPTPFVLAPGQSFQVTPTLTMGYCAASVAAQVAPNPETAPKRRRRR